MEIERNSCYTIRNIIYYKNLKEVSAMTGRECADKLLLKYSTNNSINDSHQKVTDSIRRYRLKKRLCRRLNLIFRPYCLDLMETALSSDVTITENEYNLFCFLFENIDPNTISENQKDDEEISETDDMEAKDAEANSDKTSETGSAENTSDCTGTADSHRVLNKIDNFNRWEIIDIRIRKKLLTYVKKMFDKDNTINKYIHAPESVPLKDMYPLIQVSILHPQAMRICYNTFQIYRYFKKDDMFIFNTFDNFALVSFDKDFRKLVSTYGKLIRNPDNPKTVISVSPDVKEETYRKTCLKSLSAYKKWISEVSDSECIREDKDCVDMWQDSFKITLYWKYYLWPYYVNIHENYRSFERFIYNPLFMARVIPEDKLTEFDQALCDLLIKYFPYTGGRLCPFPYTEEAIDAEFRSWQCPEVTEESYKAQIIDALKV